MALSHQEVVSRWINHPSREAKGFAMFYEQSVIYSWGKHFPIARTMIKNGRRIALFTTGTYSSSTAKHKSCVRYGLVRANIKTFTVPLILHESERAQAFNVESYKERIKEQVEKSLRARTYKAFHMEAAQRLQAEMMEYARIFSEE
jgi:hypothetical protein